ncbi:putative Sin3 associated polypeptide p18 [Aphelenchoides avenae]|nr:putative Sin3 associated polypeptide p18 [Aphelenchus avenae]
MGRWPDAKLRVAFAASDQNNAQNSRSAHHFASGSAAGDRPRPRKGLPAPLLRIFFANSATNKPLEEYARGSVPPNELQVDTWMGRNLRELMSLIKAVNIGVASARSRVQLRHR